MKKILYLFSAMLLYTAINGQQTITKTITHDGIARSFILYIPANYTGDEDVPLLLNFHGLSSNATQQMFYGDFRSIADTAGFIIVHPEGTVFNNVTHWNVGDFTAGSTVDDIGFTSALLDTLLSDYSINSDRVYSTGMSNGGYMSFLLACQLSERIAAIASVTGSMTASTYTQCDPQHPMPILQIHGTADGTVPYIGAAWTRSIEDVREFWVNYNNANPNDRLIVLEDINMTDGSTVIKFINDEGDRGTTVEHYQVFNGQHTWPGTIFDTPGTNYDISASQVIWDFFKEYDINGKIGLVANEELTESSFNYYPNPVGSTLYLSDVYSQNTSYAIHDLSGKTIIRGALDSNRATIDLNDLSSGIYLLEYSNQLHKIIKE